MRHKALDLVRQTIDRTAPDLEESLRYALAREICRALQGRTMPYEAAIQTVAHRHARNQRIRAAFDGSNVQELAQRWGCRSGRSAASSPANRGETDQWSPKPPARSAASR